MKILLKIKKTLTFLIICSNLNGQEAIYNEIELLVSQKKYKKVETIIMNKISMKEDEYLLELLGDIYGFQKKWKKSKDQYKKLIEVNPNNANYHYKYGGALGMMALENKLNGFMLVDDIKATFIKSAKLDPNHIDVRWALLELYIQLPAILGGSFKQAEQYANELSAILEIEGLLAKVYIANYRGREEEKMKYSKMAMKYIHTVKEDYPRNNINYQIGKIAANYNINLDEGIMHLNRFIKNYSDADNVTLNWIYLNLAKIYKLKNEKSNALISIEKALAIHPNFKWALEVKQEIEQM